MHTLRLSFLLHFTALHLIFSNFFLKKTYTQKYSSWFTRLEYNKTWCFGFSLAEESRNFSSFPTYHCYPPFTGDQCPRCGLMWFCALHYGFAPLPLTSLSSSPSLLSKMAAEGKYELPRLYLPPKPTYWATSFANPPYLPCGLNNRLHFI